MAEVYGAPHCERVAEAETHVSLSAYLYNRKLPYIMAFWDQLLSVVCSRAHTSEWWRTGSLQSDVMGRSLRESVVWLMSASVGILELTLTAVETPRAKSFRRSERTRAVCRLNPVCINASHLKITQGEQSLSSATSEVPQLTSRSCCSRRPGCVGGCG